MNFLGSFWIVPLVGSLFSSQNPFQSNNQDASQLPEAVSAGYISPSIDLLATESERLDPNPFLSSQSSYASGFGLLFCSPASCRSNRSLLTFNGLNDTHSFIYAPADGYSAIVDLTNDDLKGFQTWIRTVDNRVYPLGGLNAWPLISTPAWFKSSSLDVALPLLAEPTQLLDLKAPPRKFQSYLTPLSQWTNNPEFDIWAVISDVKVIPAIQTEPDGGGIIQGESTDPLGPFSLENCFTCKTKFANDSNVQLEEWFQVWVKDHLVAEVASQQTANLLAEKFRDLLHESDLDWSALQPAIVNGLPAAKAGDEILFTVEDALVSPSNQPPPNYANQKLAVEWVNNLRVALGKAPLTIISAEEQPQPILKKTEKRFKGTASWYGPYFHGRLTATGEIFNQNELTAAHPSLPFDTYLQVRNLLNDKTVVVRVNDRGPYIGNRSLDLSREAARRLDSETIGVIPYEAVIMVPITLEDTELPPTSHAPY